MHEVYELKEMLMNELEEYGRKRDLSTGSLEVIDKLAHTIKNLCKIIEAAEEEGGSSYAGGGGGSSYRSSYARGGQGGGGNRGGGGSSNRGGSSSYEGGGSSYARGRGRSRGRYSSERGYSGDPEEMVEQLRELMEDAPDEMIRKDIEKLLRKVEQQM